jgi:8-oxo-dGTP pyrophosphatase MutT (NUDIX family)
MMMGRPVPTGNDAHEWRLWLFENAASGVGYMADKIAAAMGKGASVSKSMSDQGSAPENNLSSSGSWPRITSRSTTRISPWVTLMAREVEFSPGAESETYHSIVTFDYVVVLALTRDGRVPLVRQYRPAVEDFTFELPGGIIDTAEDAAGTATRELLEETGFPSKTVHLLGVTKNDAGRLGNRVHSYFIETETQMPNFRPEDGLTIHFVTPSELVDMIVSGSFDAQANLGTLLLAVIRGHFNLRS